MFAVRRTTWVALIVFAAGVMNILSSLWAMGQIRLHYLQSIVPLQVSDISRTLTVEIGIFLILVSYGLWLRKTRAWYLALAALIPVLATNLVKGLDFEESLVNLIVMYILFRDRRLFNVRSLPLTSLSVLKTTIIIILALTLYSVIGMYALRGDFRAPMTWQNAWSEYLYLTSGYGSEQLTPVTGRARWLYDSIAFSAALALILFLPALFAPFVKKSYSTERDRDDALSLIYRTGSNSTSPMAGIPDKIYYFNNDRTCCVAYRLEGKFAVVLGDPIGYEEERGDLIQEFTTYCDSCGLKPIWYNVDESMLPYYHGYKSILIGDEALIDLASFSLQGSGIKDVRNAVTKLTNEGITFEYKNFTDLTPEELKIIDQMHQAWLKGKKLTPMSFSLEYYPLPIDQKGLIQLGHKNHELVSAISYFAYKRGKAYVIDLMLRSSRSPNGIIETAIAHAATHLYELGSLELNLSLAPLVLKEGSPRNEFLEKFEHWYKFRPLRAFKGKFAPTWLPKFFVYPSHIDLPGAAIAVVRAHMHRRDHS